MNFLYPRLQLRSLPWLLGSALSGAMVAGCYGIIHDQITFSISPEYFTKLKFAQFHWADLGLPARLFVAQIGFLASWWVGLIAGWFIGRVTIRPEHAAHRAQANVRAFATMFCVAVTGTLTGYLFGLFHKPDYGLWSYFAERGVSDLPAFVRVAYIHNGSYLGGFAGLVGALLQVRRGFREQVVIEPAIAE